MAGFEQAFCAVVNRRRSTIAVTRAPRKSVVAMDMKRATAVGISLAKFGVSQDAILRAIMRLDESVFKSSEYVEAIIKCIPKDDERKVLLSIKQAGNMAALSDAECFCLKLLSIPSIDARMSTFLLKFTMGSQLEDLQKVVTTHTLAVVS